MSTRKVKVEYTVTTQHKGVCEVEIEEDEFQEWNGSTPVSTDAVLLAGFLESARNGWEPPDGLPSPGPSDTEVSIDYADWVSS
ncbi:MAG: hypothetical protein ACR2P2_11915 [Nakamurella sp.]